MIPSLSVFAARYSGQCSHHPSLVIGTTVPVRAGSRRVVDSILITCAPSIPRSCALYEPAIAPEKSVTVNPARGRLLPPLSPVGVGGSGCGARSVHSPSSGAGPIGRRGTVSIR